MRQSWIRFSTTDMTNNNEADSKPAPSRVGCPSPCVTLVPWIAGAIGVLVNAGLLLNNIPLNCIFELAISHFCYLEHNPSVVDLCGYVPEEWCKVDGI